MDTPRAAALSRTSLQRVRNGVGDDVKDTLRS